MNIEHKREGERQPKKYINKTENKLKQELQANHRTLEFGA
jgi:hypothetical protein